MNEQDNVTNEAVNDNTGMISQSIAVEDGNPYMCKPYKSIGQKVGMFAVPCFLGLIYLTIVIFMIVMFYRLVKATEKIAAKLESGITVKNENTETSI
jgi:hypothetical protein